MLCEPFAGHCKGRPRAVGDHLPFPISDNRHEADHGLIGIRLIGGDEPHAAIAKMQQERRVAGQPVELGNNQARSADLGATNGTAKLGPVVALAAFDLGYFLQQPAAMAGHQRLHRVALCFQTEPRAALALCRNAVVVVARVDDITAILFASSLRAWRADDQRWKERYGWFAAIMSELFDELPSKPLDG
jgi:hypothetical protein